MSNNELSIHTDDASSKLGRILLVSSAVAALITLAIISRKLDEFAVAFARARSVHLPSLDVLAAAPPMVQTHVLAALAAVGLGAVMMWSRKGRRFHRIAGWIWVALIMSVALSSLFIFDLNNGRWSYLHLGSGWVLVFAPLAVLAARRHRVSTHRAIMLILFFGSLLISGVLAFLPGRLMSRLFFG